LAGWLVRLFFNVRPLAWPGSGALQARRAGGRTQCHGPALVRPAQLALSELCSVSQKIPPEDLWQFFQNGWEFFNQILYVCYAFLSTLDYEFLFNYLQL